MWSQFDLDGNGYLDYDEFVQMFTALLHLLPLEIRIKIFWSTVDADGDGVLSADEFKAMVEKLDLGDEDAEMIVRNHFPSRFQ